MYCPNCKQEFPGKFCPECGTKLIEKPAQNDISLGLGGNAAVVGGINIQKTETHNTTSYIEMHPSQAPLSFIPTALAQVSPPVSHPFSLSFTL